MFRNKSPSSKQITVGRIIPPFFFESSESDRVFNYLHDSNSIFRTINSEWMGFGLHSKPFSEEFLGKRFDRVSGTLGFFLESQVSLMIITMLVAGVGPSLMLLRRLLTRWVFLRSRFTSGTLRKTLRCGRNSEWRWRRKENVCVLIGKASNRRATCTMAVPPLHYLDWNGRSYICSVKRGRLRLIRLGNNA